MQIHEYEWCPTCKRTCNLHVKEVREIKCRRCNGHGHLWGREGKVDCFACNGTCNAKITIIDDKTVWCNIDQFLMRDNPTRKMATKPANTKIKSRDILTEVMSQLIDVSNDMIWYNFEEAGSNERAKKIGRQLQVLRGTLGDYVHALREEANGH